VNDYFIVYDRVTDNLIGRLIDLSVGGAMMITEEPVEIPCISSCRMALPKKVRGYRQVEFDIMSKWCQRNDSIGMYETGYQFINLTRHSKELIKIIVEKWTTEQTVLEHPKDIPLHTDE
jgi:c-di-GMP-binding flagellar brake protein YcgR